MPASYLCAKFRERYDGSKPQILIGSGFQRIIFFFQCTVAQEEHGHEHEAEVHGKKEKKGGFDANEVIFGHVLDAHEFHFLEYEGSDGKEHHVTIPLPVILYQSTKRLFRIYVFGFIMENMR